MSSGGQSPCLVRSNNASLFARFDVCHGMYHVVLIIVINYHTNTEISALQLGARLHKPNKGVGRNILGNLLDLEVIL